MSRLWLRSPTIVIFSALVCSSASGGSITILNVDFNDNSPTTTSTDANGVGFRGFDISDSPAKTFGGLDPALTSGAVTVALSNLYPGGFRDRASGLPGGGSNSFGDLYRDFVAFLGPNSLVPALTLYGLNPDTDYTLTFQSFDNNSDHPGTTLYTDVTTGGATNGLSTTAYFLPNIDPSGCITDFSSPGGGSATFTVRSNTLGQLVFAVGDPNGSAGNYDTQINGFELASSVAAVPEPPSIMLAATGLWSILAAKRNARGRRVALLCGAHSKAA